MLPNEIQNENPAQIGVLAIAPAVTTALISVIPFVFNYLSKLIVDGTLEKDVEPSKKVDDLKLKSLEDKYQELVKNIATSPQNERILAGQFLEDVFGNLKSQYQMHYANIKNDLLSIVVDKNVDVVKNLILSFKSDNRYDVIENIFFLLNKKGIIPDVLNLKEDCGYSTHLCFNQNFKIITGLLKNLKGSDETSVIEVLTKKDTCPLRATILDAASLMGSVATPEFLNVVTELYSDLASRHPSLIKINKKNLILPSENFKKIFTEDYFKSISLENFEKLLKLTSRLFSTISTYDQSLVESTNELMRSYDLNPCTPYKEGGYEDTTVQGLWQYQTMLYTLKSGGCISIREDTKSQFLKFMKTQISDQEAIKLMSDENKVSVVVGRGEGSIAISEGQNISSFVAEQFMKNLEYVRKNLQKIRDRKSDSPQASVASQRVDSIKANSLEL